MKNSILLSIATIISLTATQSMPMASIKSFFSKHTPTYEQAVGTIRKTQTTLINNARKTIAYGITSCVRAAHSFNTSKEELVNRLFNAAIHGHLNMTKAPRTTNTNPKWYQATPVRFATLKGHNIVETAAAAAHTQRDKDKAFHSHQAARIGLNIDKSPTVTSANSKWYQAIPVSFTTLKNIIKTSYYRHQS
ncbi:MAG TPA: hypothetical protein PKD74_00235 [Candidatus Dependentiae bacterium]|jgi:hypothetical protein|nr:hypothetical protein [Candidatus Dependentiae bacterium]